MERSTALDALVGTWRMEGEQLAGPFGPAAKVSAREKYEWLPGGRFLIHRFDGRVGDAEAACIEIISYDAGRGAFPRVTYYSDGAVREWDSREEDGTWTLTQAGGAGQDAPKVRCTLALRDGDTAMTGNWEYSNDGETWRTFWDVRATKESR
jgi:hypothetical protein